MFFGKFVFNFKDRVLDPNLKLMLLMKKLTSTLTNKNI